MWPNIAKTAPTLKLHLGISSTSDAFISGEAAAHILVYVEASGPETHKTASEVLDQALLAHRISRERKFYVHAPKRCLRQMLKVAGWTMWRIRKNQPQARCEIMTAYFTRFHWWLYGTAGLVGCLFHQNSLTQVFPPLDPVPQLEELGTRRQAQWRESEGALSKEDIMLVGNPELFVNLNQKLIQEILISGTTGHLELTALAGQIINMASKQQKSEYGAILIQPYEVRPISEPGTRIS